jgi:TusA-related sulfurtransferase
MTDNEIIKSVTHNAMFRETAMHIASEFKGHELVKYIEHLLYLAYDWTPETGWALRQDLDKANA